MESASGLSYEGWLREKIFLSAGMTSASLHRNREIVAHRARFYRKSDSGTAVANAPYVDNSYNWAAGGVLATADDLARFAVALDTGKIPRPDPLRCALGFHCRKDSAHFSWNAFCWATVPTSSGPT